MKNLIIILLFIIITSFTPIKHTNKFNGVIVDSVTNEKLTGVKILINDTVIFTDLNGEFEFEFNVDSLNLNINYISYKDLNWILTKNDKLIKLVRD